MMNPRRKTSLKKHYAVSWEMCNQTVTRDFQQKNQGNPCKTRIPSQNHNAGNGT